MKPEPLSIFWTWTYWFIHLLDKGKKKGILRTLPLRLSVKPLYENQVKPKRKTQPQPWATSPCLCTGTGTGIQSGIRQEGKPKQEEMKTLLYCRATYSYSFSFTHEPSFLDSPFTVNKDYRCILSAISSFSCLSPYLIGLISVGLFAHEPRSRKHVV